MTNIKSLKECKVLVTPTSFARYNKELAKKLEGLVGEVTYNTKGRPLDELELIPIIDRFDGFIAGLDQISAKVIERAKNLKVICRYGAGIDRVDLEAAKRAGIIVTNTPGVNSASVAELTVGLAIDLARNICSVSYLTKKGQWPRVKGIALKGKTMGLIGFGNISREVAKRLHPFGCKILAYDLNFNYAFAKKYKIKYASLDDILTNSDFISLHVPHLKSTHKMVNRDFLKKMKRGAFLINTARGELIDEKDLYKFIKEGHVAGAALDVFCEEPCSEKNPLFSLPQVIATAHLGASTDDASNEMTKQSISDCLDVLQGKIPNNIVIKPAIT